MNLALIVNGLTKPAAFRSWLRPSPEALRPALAAVAAVAGYVIFLPSAPQPAPAVASLEDTRWAGNIEAPAAQEQQASAPITSASYAAPETAVAGISAKKAGIAGVAPKTSSKQAALPPRRPAPNEDQTHVAAAAGPAPVVTPLTGPTPDETVPPEATAPRHRSLLSPITDRLPTRGTLLKPFHVVGDAFHNLFKSF